MQVSDPHKIVRGSPGDWDRDSLEPSMSQPTDRHKTNSTVDVRHLLDLPPEHPPRDRFSRR